MRYLNMYLVNAFTSVPFNGNPTGVVIGSSKLSDEEMQKIAHDMRMSETVFIRRLDVGVYDTRFFTPTKEIDLCGHATIATFYALCKHQYILPIEEGIKKVVQHTKSGKVYVELEYKNSDIENVYILLNGTRSEKLSTDDEIASALGVDKSAFGVLDRELSPDKIKTGLQDIVVPIKDLETLQSIEPNFDEILKITERENAVSVELFCLLEGGRVVQRTFSPGIGVNEEAGSATSTGASLFYLKNHTDFSLNEIHSTQGENLGRKSQLFAQSIDDKKLRVGGKAFVFLEGVLHI